MNKTYIADDIHVKAETAKKFYLQIYLFTGFCRPCAYMAARSVISVFNHFYCVIDLHCGLLSQRLRC